MNKMCDNCPWKDKTHPWVEYVKDLFKIGKIKSHKHACHQKTDNTWKKNSKCLCVGSILEDKK